MTEPRGEELVARYKANYQIPTEAPVTEEMILRHWDLEQALTRRLLDSTPADRWQVFEDCYTQLYSELDWLNDVVSAGAVASDVRHADWTSFIGRAPKTVYEVGSGKGELIAFLARSGYSCKGSEVTRERGQRWAEEHPNLSWGVTDGIHLDRFEPAGGYEVVISDQVIEHLHPDDLITHMRSANALLVPGGRYVFSTPHRYYGPMDVSRVFGCDEPRGMHLKEYTFKELMHAAREAGFSGLYAPVRVPLKIRKLFGGRPRPFNSRTYLRYLRLIETVIGLLPRQSMRRKVARAMRLILFDGVILVAHKR